MQDIEELKHSLEELKRQHGEWAYDIPLPFNIWTKGNLQEPHTRLRRIVQIVQDLSRKPLSECRVLDLGCLDGLFSIEFAMRGARTVGIEIREANIKKALFCKESLGLDNLEFYQDDVRNISIESYGRFDAIICSGILYHLTGTDVINLIDRMFDLVSRVVVIDTHISLSPSEPFILGRDIYWGRTLGEHHEDATQEEREMALLSSWGNNSSFHFTRPSLMNILQNAGFSSVYECFVPIHMNFGKPGIGFRDRCTFVALKEDICEIITSPAANALKEQWPEGSLVYAP